MKFKEYKGLDLVATGAEVLESWKKNHTFGKSLEKREGATESTCRVSTSIWSLSVKTSSN